MGQVGARAGCTRYCQGPEKRCAQSNSNAQILPVFDRVAARRCGLTWHGQVSIYDWLGYKIPSDPNPSKEAAEGVEQSSHGRECHVAQLEKTAALLAARLRLCVFRQHSKASAVDI
jgi:hypothetical protein